MGFQLTRDMNQQSVPRIDLLKKKNRILRWNLLWAAIVFGAILGIGLAPLWLYKVVGCKASWYVTATIFILCDAVFLISAIVAWPSLWAEWRTYKNTHPELRHFQETELTPTGQHINRNQKDVAVVDPERGLPELAHLVIMVGYKEPVDLICKTIDTIAAQTRAGNIIMVVGLEERTPEYESKIKYFQNRYKNSFHRFIPTVHPYNIPGEIAGTCSNVNWAIRQSTTQLRDEGTPLDPEMTIVTKMDTDAMFLPNHFEILEREFLKLPKQERLECTFQSPLMYNLSLDERWFFTRVTGILRTFFMLAFLIPHSINTMSIYHLSLSLARNAGYWIPHYQMEDIIQNLNFMCGIGKQVKIKLIPLPVVSGPTSGRDLMEEYYEWYMQARRWTIGAAEVFHYYMIKFLGRKFDCCSGLSYGFSFILYYGGILCVVGLYQLVVVIASLFDTCDQDENNSWLFPSLLAVKYVVVFGTAYFADGLHRRITGIEEPGLEGVVGWIRSIMHYLSTILVLLAYNMVEVVGIIEMSYRGRDVCGHIPANKASLLGGDGKKQKKKKPGERFNDDSDDAGMTELADSSRFCLEASGRHRTARVQTPFDLMPHRETLFTDDSEISSASEDGDDDDEPRNRHDTATGNTDGEPDYCV